MRTITITVDGKEYTFPATMNILRKAEDFSGISTPRALGDDNKMPFKAEFMLGIICAGMQFAGAEVDYKTLGDEIAWHDLSAIYTSITDALTPETVAGARKNAPKGKSAGTGPASSGSGSDSSS